MKGTTHHAPQTCTCGYVMDCTTAVDGVAVPKPGDVTLCLKCGRVFVFDQNMNLEQAPADVCNDPEVRRAQRAIWRIQ